MYRQQARTVGTRFAAVLEVCVWKTKGNDLLNGIIGHGSGTLKIRQVEGTVPLPTCGEELQHGHRLTGMSWLVLRTMSSDILEAYGFVLGRRANCAISGYFANEYEIRKKAYHLVRDGVGRPPAHELALFASGQLASSPLQTKGKGVRKHALKPKTMGGKRVCFKFTNGGKCADSCGYAHVASFAWSPAASSSLAQPRIRSLRSD